MTTSTPVPKGPRFDLPTIEEESRPFWNALKDGRLMIGRCKACTRAHYYPRPFCPYCWSEDVALEASGGRGVLYTYSTIHVNDLPPFKEWLPYVAAIVDLDEGVRVTTNIVGCDPASLKIGMRVAVEFVEITPEISKAVFRPA